MADELNWLSATKLVKAYKKRKLSPVEVTRACLNQIARHDLALNAMCLVDEEGEFARVHETIIGQPRVPRWARPPGRKSRRA